MSGSVCSVSITERSSGSCTTAQVACVREVEELRRRAIAVELGEVGEDAATQAHAGEHRPRRAVDLVEVGDAEGWDLLQGELQEPGLLGHDGGRRKPGAARDLGRRRELVGHRPLAGHRDLQHDLGIEGLRQARDRRPSVSTA